MVSSSPKIGTAVAGGGLVGLAIAYGLVRCGEPVTVLDEGDAARPASVGNFGLVWVQSKGMGMPVYTAWTARSARLWPRFAATLAETTGIDVGHTRPGGLHLCLGDAELEQRAQFVNRMSAQMRAAGCEVRMLNRAETRELAPAIGDRVIGASFCALDGHANPLLLVRALMTAAKARGLRHRPRSRVRAVRALGYGYALDLADGETVVAERVVLASGLGNRDLAATLGKAFPVQPQRGQILVTRRLPRFLDLPTTHVRQTAEGSVMLGDSKEDVGLDYGTSIEAGRMIADRAIASFPVLRDAQVVRSWGALRVMSPDGLPIYQSWPDLPGLHALACHSGVTLAAVHAEVLAPAIAGAEMPAEAAAFTAERFDVQDARAS
jgi:glycine/D-amino acid oxidase-like deaminating enzyme